MASDLNLEAVIGFEGNIKNGLCYVKRDSIDYLVYALGSTIVVKNINANTQSFCQGHSNKVSCITVSNDGSMIAFFPLPVLFYGVFVCFVFCSTRGVFFE